MPRPLLLLASTFGLLLAVVLDPGALQAASGTWSVFDSPGGFDASVLTLNPADGTIWVAGVSAESNGSGGFLLMPQIASRSLSDGGTFANYPSDGLTNATQDLTVSGLYINKLGIPVAKTIRTVLSVKGVPPPSSLGPFLYFYDSTASISWSPSTTPPNEQSNWVGGPGMVIDDNGDPLAAGANLVLHSTDGANWTTQGDLRQFIMAPPPYTNVGVASGKPSWIQAPTYITNIPRPNPDTFGPVYGMARMPWGEILIGGECGSYVHSLDNGQTWEWFDPAMSLPQRDAQGIPSYPNPACFRISKTFDAVATKDGEVMFNCQRNDGHHFFIWTAAGNVIEAAQGLPTGTIYPGLCTQFATVAASGDTFMSVMWSNYTAANQHPLPDSPTGHGVDIYKWDGASWTILTADFGVLGWSTTVANSLLSDGAHLYTPTINNGLADIRMWTPDLSGGAPPRVAISGGTSATAGPSTMLDAATGQASAQLSATISSDNTATAQWSARGPGITVFEDANTVSPRVWFTVPGNYVLNLRAVDGVTQLSAGASVIVHVLPAAGGAVPAISTQPRNQIGVTTGTGSATFTIQAAGSGTLRYQWKRNGIDITNNASAQTASLTVADQFSDNGSAYHCIVSSAYGRVVSNCAMLGTPPVIATSPVKQVVTSGGYAVFSVAATGTQPFQWRWLRNNAPITTGSAATNNAGSFTTNLPGSYSVVVSNLFGSATSASATLTVGVPPPQFYLVVNAVASPSTTGGYATNEAGNLISPSYPLNTAIPFGAETAPLSEFYNVLSNWSVTSGGTIANSSLPQTTVKGTVAGATVVVTTTYKDPSALPLYYLNVVNGHGSGFGRASVSSSSSAPVTMSIAAAPPPPEYVFDRWTGATVASTASAQTTITLSNPNAQTTVTAHYLPTPYMQWRLQQFGANARTPAISGDTADPDGDGVANLMEYALGTSPLDGATGRASQVPDLETIVADQYLRLTIPKNPAATDITYVVQVSEDLRVWSSIATVVEVNTSTTLVVRDIVPYATATRRFMRLQVTRP